MRAPIFIKFDAGLKDWGQWGILIPKKAVPDYWPDSEDHIAYFYLSNTGNIVPVGLLEARRLNKEQ